MALPDVLRSPGSPPGAGDPAGRDVVHDLGPARARHHVERAPAVKEEHQLRTDGPYGVTRHPIYTGMLGMFLGCLLVAGGGRWITPFPVFLVLLEIKLHIEERLMQAEFPDDYPRYRQRVPQLVPGLKLISRHRMAIG